VLFDEGSQGAAITSSWNLKIVSSNKTSTRIQIDQPIPAKGEYASAGFICRPNMHPSYRVVSKK